jgi:hypothetical protein
MSTGTEPAVPARVPTTCPPWVPSGRLKHWLREHRVYQPEENEAREHTSSRLPRAGLR